MHISPIFRWQHQYTLLAIVVLVAGSLGFVQAQPQQSQVQLNSTYSFSADLNSGLTGASCQAGSHCSVNVSGGLFGAQGQRLGLSYTLSPGTTQSKIDGVAVFKR